MDQAIIVKGIHSVFIMEMSGLQQGCTELDDGHPVLNTLSQSAGERGGQAQVWNSLLQQMQTAYVLFWNAHTQLS